MRTVMVRLPNWLGDTVMAVPTVRALRAGLPGTRLAVAGPWASLLAGQGLADALVDYPRAWSARLRAADTVRELRADVAVLLPNSFEAAAAAWYWGATRRAGFRTNGRGWLLTDRLALPSPRRHQVDEYGMLLEPLGLTLTEREPRLAPPAEDSPERAEARALLDANGRRPGRPVVAVHLGAAFGASKLWPTDHVAAFCRLAADDGAAPVLLGTTREAGAAGDIQARGASVASLVGKDRPALLPALLAEIDVLVCGDTGVGHLAAALGTPVVTLFGPTDWRLTGPRGPVAVVRHDVPCSPCFYRTCPIEHPCMRGISPEQVMGRVRALTTRSAWA
jgi:heptosyltransferase-2